MHLTNRRLIINGVFEPTFQAIMIYKMPWMAKNELQAIQIGSRFKYPNKFCFGYQYIFKKSTHIKYKRTSLVFKTEFDMQRNYRVVQKRLRVKITINEPDFNAQERIMESLLQVLQTPYTH